MRGVLVKRSFLRRFYCVRELGLQLKASGKIRLSDCGRVSEDSKTWDLRECSCFSWLFWVWQEAASRGFGGVGHSKSL